MLEPETRELLMDLLRPPEGMRMDIAVGTTYTLDLEALLLAPLSFAMFDWASDEHGRTDPLATLEALRRHAGRTTLFCQDGMIGVPREYQGLMLHLEDAVVPISAPRKHGIFHPKVWVVRYLGENGERHWRTLVLSRNLTFDASWDTVVLLDSVHVVKQHQLSEPLAGFLRGLVELGGARLDAGRRTGILELADEIRRVRFATPEDFTPNGTWFLPFGIDVPASFAFPPEDRTRTLVVSPFLGDAALWSMASPGPERDIVVSRPETLDQLDPATLADWDCYVLATGQVEDLVETPESEDTGSLRGLHAKLLVFERGEHATVVTGSLNVTDAALRHNVECMAWMNGPIETAGIDAFIGDADPRQRRTTFGRLLERYTPSDGHPDEEDVEVSLRRELDRARIELSRLRMRAHVAPAAVAHDKSEPDDTGWRFTLEIDGHLDLPSSVNAIEIWRLTGPRSASLPLNTSTMPQTLDLGIVGEPLITAFFAVAIRAEKDGKRAETTFLARAELIGAPDGRAERMLARTLQSRDSVLRYLQFLLADGSDALRELMQELAPNGRGGRWAPRDSVDGQGILERLLEVLVTDPARLAHVERLLRDLREVEGGALLPDGFDEIWMAIDEVRREITPTREGGR
jgi:hypothetical protein